MKPMSMLCVLLVFFACNQTAQANYKPQEEENQEIKIPIANISDVETRVGLWAKFDCSSSQDPMGHDIVEFRMTFDDSQTQSFRESEFSHLYMDPGMFTAILVVITDDGRMSLPTVASIEVLPPNHAPFLECQSQDLQTTVGQGVRIPLTIHDEDGDSVSITAYYSDGSDPANVFNSVQPGESNAYCTLKTVGINFITLLPYDQHEEYGAPITVAVQVLDAVTVTVELLKQYGYSRLEIDASSCNDEATITVTIPTKSGMVSVIVPPRPDNQKDTPRILTVFGCAVAKSDYQEFSATSSLGGSCRGYIQKK